MELPLILMLMSVVLLGSSILRLLMKIDNSLSLIVYDIKRVQKILEVSAARESQKNSS